MPVGPFLESEDYSADHLISASLGGPLNRMYQASNSARNF